MRSSSPCGFWAALPRRGSAPPHEAYALLQKARIVDEYILPFYDVLHTMGREALVEDINVIAREKGVLA